MIIWRYGEVSKNKKGGVLQKRCEHCNTISEWQLSKNTTWLTLCFIPVIPCRVTYRVVCSNCGSYIEIPKEKFLVINKLFREDKVPGT